MNTLFHVHQLDGTTYGEYSGLKSYESWWIPPFLVHYITLIASIQCKPLQGHGTIIFNQRTTFRCFVYDISFKFCVFGRFSDAQRIMIDHLTYKRSDKGSYGVKNSDLRSFIHKLGSFVYFLFTEMGDGYLYALFRVSVSSIH